MDTELLIQLVKNKAYLYRKNDKGYKDLILKENAWKEIADILNSTSDECEKFWKSLKDKFTRERKKVRNVPSGSGSGEATKWVWYDDLLFLDEVIKVRRITTSNIQPRVSTCLDSQMSLTVNDMEESFSNNLECSNEEVSQCIEDSNNKSTAESSSSTTRSTSESSEHSISAEPSCSFATPRTEKLKKKAKENVANTSDVDKLIIDTIQNLNRSSEINFGNLVAHELSQLSDHELLKSKKRRILDILYE